MGLALCDSSETLASGIGTFSVQGIKSAVSIASTYAKEHGAEQFVVGLPINMNGTEGARAERTRVFAKFLEEESKLPVAFHDERRTTILAANYMNETGTGGKKRKNTIDTLSAQIILQSYIDRKKNTQ